MQGTEIVSVQPRARGLEWVLLHILAACAAMIVCLIQFGLDSGTIWAFIENEGGDEWRAVASLRLWIWPLLLTTGLQVALFVGTLLWWARPLPGWLRRPLGLLLAGPLGVWAAGLQFDQIALGLLHPRLVTGLTGEDGMLPGVAEASMLLLPLVTTLPLLVALGAAQWWMLRTKFVSPAWIFSGSVMALALSLLDLPLPLLLALFGVGVGLAQHLVAVSSGARGVRWLVAGVVAATLGTGAFYIGLATLFMAWLWAGVVYGVVSWLLLRPELDRDLQPAAPARSR